MRRALAVVAVLTVAVVALGSAPAVAAPGPADAPEYWFDQWQVEKLWSGGARGGGVTIGEIDTGVTADLPELVGNVLPGIDFGIPGDGHVDRESSEFGHGTAMASIMVGRRGILGITGIAPDAKVLPIAVPLIGTTDAANDDHLGQAIRWAVDHGSKIVSMSLGGGRRRVPGADPCPADEQEAVYYAIRKGAIVVAASGNNGPTTNTVEEPGVCLGVVSVGAVDSSGTVADFSSRHPYLTLTAPGVNIPSLSRVAGSAYSGDGTSQATAIASAVLAVVWSKFPKATNRQVLARVLATLDRSRTTRDPAYGYGTINAYRAVTGSVPGTAPNPVFEAADPFIARDQAFAVPPVRPTKTAAGERVSVGRFAVGSAPRFLVPKVLTGLSVAGAGLLALVALAIFAFVRRRRLARPVLVPAGASPPVVPQAEWREISAPGMPVYRPLADPFAAPPEPVRPAIFPPPEPGRPLGYPPPEPERPPGNPFAPLPEQDRPPQGGTAGLS